MHHSRTTWNIKERNQRMEIIRPKILFILHLPPPIHGAAMVGKYIHDSKLINRKFECRYINLALAKDLNDIGKSGLNKLNSFIQKLYYIRKTVKEFKPDLCYVTPNAKGGAFYKDFIVVQLLKILKCNIIVHYHNKGVSTRQKYLLDDYLYKHFFKNLKVILLAQSLYPDFSKYVTPNNLFICPNGIPMSNQLVQISHTKFTILFLSNMMKEKGVWTLLKACKELKEKKYVFECHFVGKWSDITEESFAKQVTIYNLNDCVYAHGAQYGEAKNKFWQLCDLFVFPTYYHNESFPMVLLEAMQQKKACISTSEGGIPEIILSGETGYIIPQKDSSFLAKKIGYLINHPHLCKNMGEKGFIRYSHLFTLSSFEANIIKILESCITSHKT